MRKTAHASIIHSLTNRVVYCVVTDPAPSQRHEKIGMMMARHRDGPCCYHDGGGKWRNSTFTRGQPCQLSRQFRSFILRKSILHCLPRPLVRQSTHPPTRSLVCPLSASIRSSACPPARSEPSSACAPVRPPVRLSIGALVHPSARPPARSPTPSAPSASFHPWSLAYKLLAVEVEHAPFV